MHAEICPICLGSGKYVKSSTNQWQDSTTAGLPETVVCHGCHGTGWVTVP